MRDRGLYWTPAPAIGEEAFSRKDLAIEVVRGIRQRLLSGQLHFGAGRLAGISGPFGFSGVATGATYAVGIARDRALVVSSNDLALDDGWLADASMAVTVCDDAYLVLDLTGAGLADLISKATTLDVVDNSPSASLLFAGLPCLAYRHEHRDKLRLHVERPLAPALREWLLRA